MESRVARSTERLLEVLADATASATFFVLGWVAERHPGLVRAIQTQGPRGRVPRIRAPDDHAAEPAEFAEDVRRAKAMLEDAAGRR